jgi:hypothetical protein
MNGVKSREELQEKKATGVAREFARITLPVLTGSVKQVAWAEKIRHDGLTKLIENVVLKEIYGQDAAHIRPMMEACLRTAENIQDAKWWIEARMCIIPALCREAGIN